ncbi:diaminopimelate decarboxylase family protein [Streptomyces sp. NPDC101227]|uniref:diaminopimelate decarboxylase family protein n=1 Tax=Streptomyces sp. NPDC101227 TaxID=3366136 RepID=UPI003808522C
MIDSLHSQAFALGRQRETPFYVFSPTRLSSALDRFNRFTSGLPFPTETYYSYKTNYLPALCDQIADAAVGSEITSPTEWAAARQRHQSNRIVVNGIGKCADGLLQRIADEVSTAPRLVNLETDTEVSIVAQRSPEADPLPVGLRVTVPSVSGELGRDPSEHWNRGVTKFGWSADGNAVLNAARALAGNRAVRLEALHLHFGSQLVSAARYDIVLQRLCDLLQRLTSIGATVSTLDLGGGLASGWVTKRRTGPLFDLIKVLGLPTPKSQQKAPDLDGITAALHKHAARLSDLGVTRLILEPGRYLAEPAMVAVSKVIAVRRDGARRHAVVDLGTNGLHCWRGNETRPIAFDPSAKGEPEEIKLVGPLCHRSDSFGTVTAPSQLQPDDLVCFDAVGAYSLGDWVANAWPRPPVLGEDGSLLWTPPSHGLITGSPLPDGAEYEG